VKLKNTPKFRELPVIVKEVFCRVGKDHRGGALFLSGADLGSIDTEIAYLAAKKLKLHGTDLHDLTCAIKTLSNAERPVKSITGQEHLAEKVLQLKIRITIEQCDLIDDINLAEEEKQ